MTDRQKYVVFSTAANRIVRLRCGARNLITYPSQSTAAGAVRTLSQALVECHPQPGKVPACGQKPHGRPASKRTSQLGSSGGNYTRPSTVLQQQRNRSGNRMQCLPPGHSHCRITSEEPQPRVVRDPCHRVLHPDQRRCCQ